LATDVSRAGFGFDVAAANFALLDDDPAPLLAALRRSLAPGGALAIQTLHPLSSGAPPYRDGWRTEEFRGFGGAHAVAAVWRPMPWYFRTLGSWLALLRESGYALLELREPLHPETALPLSLLLITEPARGDA
jgi:SAM-dependent methyltransferase